MSSTLDDEDQGPIGTKVAMFAIAIAVALGALFYGLSNIPEEAPVTYGNCKVDQGSKGKWYFQCPDLAALHVAIDEFAKKNPDYPITGVVAYKKGRSNARPLRGRPLSGFCFTPLVCQATRLGGATHFSSTPEPGRWGRSATALP